MIDTATYSRNKTKALIDVHEKYNKLEQELLKYNKFKSDVRRILRKYGCKYDISDSLYCVDVEDKRYYIKTFGAMDFDIEFVIDVNLVDFKYEKVDSVEEIPKGDYLQECFAKCIHNGSISNFDNDY